MTNQERLAHNLRKLPKVAYAVCIASGRMIMVYAGDTNRFVPADRYVNPGETPEAAVNRLNAEKGITPPQREAMYHGSMFGFHTPAADPDSYEADGRHKAEVVANTEPETMRDLFHSKSDERKVIRAFFEHLNESGHSIDFVEEIDLEACLDEFHGIDRERLEIEERIVATATR